MPNGYVSANGNTNVKKLENYGALVRSHLLAAALDAQRYLYLAKKTSEVAAQPLAVDPIITFLDKVKALAQEADTVLPPQLQQNLKLTYSNNPGPVD
ncbi:MAG: hypothetical protein ACR2PL_07215 [Dehalococcoidia bacterium]